MQSNISAFNTFANSLALSTDLADISVPSCGSNILLIVISIFADRHIFKTTNLLTSNIVMALLGAAWIPMWFFLKFYLQQKLDYNPFESGLALLPMTVMIMILMVSITPRLESRFDIKRNLVMGLGLMAAGILVFSLTHLLLMQHSTHSFYLCYPVR